MAEARKVGADAIILRSMKIDGDGPGQGEFAPAESEAVAIRYIPRTP